MSKNYSLIKLFQKIWIEFIKYLMNGILLKLDSETSWLNLETAPALIEFLVNNIALNNIIFKKQ